jgi:hypothetical protein
VRSHASREPDDGGGERDGAAELRRDDRLGSRTGPWQDRSEAELRMVQRPR